MTWRLQVKEPKISNYFISLQNTTQILINDTSSFQHFIPMKNAQATVVAESKINVLEWI